MRSLSECYQFLRTQHPDEVVEIQDPMDPKACHHAALQDMAAASGRYPWFVFHDARTLNGERWQGLFTSDASSSLRRMGLLLGLDLAKNRPFDLVLRYHAGTKVVSEPEQVVAAAAPVKARVYRGGQGPLGVLPAWRNCEEDSPPGWFTPIWIVRDPDSGRYNLSWHRSQVVDPEAMTIRFYPPRHIHSIFQRYRQLGRPMPVAAVVSHHPAFGLAAATQFDLTVDELQAAAGSYQHLTGHPLRVVPSETWGEQLLVPADAEVVIEGHIDPAATVMAGPWADAWRYYAPRVPMQMVRVTAVTTQERPLVEGIQPKSHLYDTLAFTALAYDLAFKRYPRIRSINMPHLQTLIVAYDAVAPGETTNLGYAFFQVGCFVKHLILVDGSIDPYDLDEVFFALASRVDAHQRVQLVTTRIPPNDPSATGATAGGMIIDATTPLDRDFPKEGVAPAAAQAAMAGLLPAVLAGVPVRRKTGW